MAVSIAVAAFLYAPSTKKCVTCPFAAPKLKQLPQFSEQYRDEMLWGSYRPGLYMGMRARLPKSLQLGLMWLDPDALSRGSEPRLRHKASQDDRLQTYGWLQHDGRSYGHQALVDSPFNISVHMVKLATSGSGRGGDWALRISASDAKDPFSGAGVGEARQRLSLLLYLWDEDQPAVPLTAEEQPDKAVHLQDGTLLLRGASKALGSWQLLASQAGGSAAPKVRVNYLAAPVTTEQAAVQLDRLTLDALAHAASASNTLKLQLPNVVVPDANLAMVQLTFRLPGSFDIVFLSNPHHDGPARLQLLTGDPLSALIKQRSREFERRFDEELLDGRQLEGEARRVLMSALSNLVGGMGYFYGSSRVQLLPGDNVAPDQVLKYWPEQLYTAVPSRSFFPRGFLWDEGFHHLLLRRWDPALGRDSLAHWLDLLNSYGWIPREQILGEEARARVPAPYVNQHPSHANPPSLLLPLTKMAATLAAAIEAGHTDGQADADRELLRAAWPRLEAWYKWYNSTQAGPVPGSFMWHGRDAVTELELNPKTLMSGLDDFPRASHPTDEERHLDLLAWMALASQAMATIGAALKLPEQAVAPYRWAAAKLADEEHLVALHWDSERQVFADWGLHTEDVRLERVQGQGQEPIRVVGTPPKPQFVPHFGYVSLFPLLLRLLPPSSPRLLQQLNKLADPNLLWTRYGLRSLAPTSSLYQVHNTPHDRPYWRGPVWMSVNYLAASSLHYYCGEGVQRACGLYEELRGNLVRNVVEQYKTTGYMWEQYKDGDGQGLGSHPFTGWTALVALVAAEAY